MNNQDLTLLSEGQIWGNEKESQLEVMRKYGTKAAITDLCFEFRFFTKNIYLTM